VDIQAIRGLKPNNAAHLSASFGLISPARACKGKIAFGLALALVLIESVRQTSADEIAIAKGERIYENYCATCHGEQLKNNSAGLSFDLRRLRSDDHSRFVNSVKNGKNKMPPWNGVLDEAQIEQLWSYIQANTPW
jgi:mono/diheme cytochrome c family protein